MPDLQQEQERIQAAKQDPAHFASLYEENFYRVYAYIARRVTDRATAEDLTSEAFREALASLPKFEWQGVPFIAWLLRLASRILADHFKRVGREPLEVMPDSDGVQINEIEQHAALFQLVDRLPEAQFRVIHMRFVEQKSIREIAGALGRTEGAVKQLQLRAIENLRAQLEGANV